jgi:processive 1,2-diacylglycerol beta-glucosyltransferase
MYGKGYLDLVNHAPELVGVLYEGTDRPPRNRALERLKLAVERLNTRRLVELVRDVAPDVIVHTHFLPAAIVAHERRRRRLQAPHAVVVTDYEVHRFWRCPGVARYFVAREENRVHLEALREPGEAVRVTGIPVLPVFAEEPDRAALRARHHLPEDGPLLLVLSGGFGVGPVEAIVKSLWAHVRKGRMVIVAGRNERLRERLARLATRAAVPTTVLGFTHEMHDWMALADLAVTKPGGLTTAEALGRCLPLVVVNPIPGQETRNATMLYEAGAALSGENPNTIGFRVGKLLESPERLAAMRAAARRLGRPRAAFEIADELEQVIDA